MDESEEIGPGGTDTLVRTVSSAAAGAETSSRRLVFFVSKSRFSRSNSDLISEARARCRLRGELSAGDIDQAGFDLYPIMAILALTAALSADA